MAAGAFIMAAGFGSRLRPLTEYRPKPLVPVCGVPLLSYVLEMCGRHGIDSVLVNAHHLPDQLLAWDGVHEGVTVEVVFEPVLLGTGGGLKAVEDRLAERIVILNGDVLHTVDLVALRALVPEGGGALVLRPHPEDADRYGHVSADATGTIVQMRDFAATEPVGPVRNDTHFTGIHAIHRGLLEDAVEGFSGILRTAHTARIGDRVLKGMRYEGPWLDIGDPDAYLDTNLDVLHGRVRLGLDPLARAAEVREGPVWVGPGATIHPDADLKSAVIGAGAVVGPVRVRDAVVWDGVELKTDLTQGIAHDGGIWSR